MLQEFCFGIDKPLAREGVLSLDGTGTGTLKDATAHGLWHRRKPGNYAAAVAMDKYVYMVHQQRLQFVCLFASYGNSYRTQQSKGHIAQIAQAIVLRFQIFCK